MLVNGLDARLVLDYGIPCYLRPRPSRRGDGDARYPRLRELPLAAREVVLRVPLVATEDRGGLRHVHAAPPA